MVSNSFCVLISIKGMAMLEFEVLAVKKKYHKIMK